MRSQSLEIFLGLVYMDYADDPFKEARIPTGATTNGNHD